MAKQKLITSPIRASSLCPGLDLISVKKGGRRKRPKTCGLRMSVRPSSKYQDRRRGDRGNRQLRKNLPSGRCRALSRKEDKPRRKGEEGGTRGGGNLGNELMACDSTRRRKKKKPAVSWGKDRAGTGAWGSPGALRGLRVGWFHRNDPAARVTIQNRAKDDRREKTGADRGSSVRRWLAGTRGTNQDASRTANT